LPRTEEGGEKVVMSVLVIVRSRIRFARMVALWLRAPDHWRKTLSLGDLAHALENRIKCAKYSGILASCSGVGRYGPVAVLRVRSEQGFGARVVSG
jgi:hypothetical protein